MDINSAEYIVEQKLYLLGLDRETVEGICGATKPALLVEAALYINTNPDCTFEDIADAIYSWEKQEYIDENGYPDPPEPCYE